MKLYPVTVVRKPVDPRLALPGRFIPSNHICNYINTRLFCTCKFLNLNMKFVYKMFCNFWKHRGSNPGNPNLALPGRFIPSSHIWYYMKTKKNKL